MPFCVGALVRMLVVSASVVATASPALSSPKPLPCKGCWIPRPVTSWQWQLQGKIDQTVKARMFDVDTFDTPASVVRSLHAKGRRVVCYVDAGTWENWRPDKSKFPKSVLGRKNGWPGERWLDSVELDNVTVTRTTLGFP